MMEPGMIIKKHMMLNLNVKKGIMENMKRFFLIICFFFLYSICACAQKINTGKTKLDRSKNVVAKTKHIVTESKKSQPKRKKKKTTIYSQKNSKKITQEENEESEEEYDYSEYSPSDLYESLGQGVFAATEEETSEEQSTSFYVSDKNISFDSNNSTKTILVNSSNDWFIDTQPDNWVHLKKIENDKGLIINVDANTKYYAREVFFTIKSAGKIEKIHIKQSAMPFE